MIARYLLTQEAAKRITASGVEHAVQAYVFFAGHLLQVINSIIIPNAIAVVNLFARTNQVVRMVSIPYQMRAHDAPPAAMLQGGRMDGGLVWAKRDTHIPMSLPDSASPSRMLLATYRSPPFSPGLGWQVVWLEACSFAMRVMAMLVKGWKAVGVHSRNRRATATGAGYHTTRGAFNRLFGSMAALSLGTSQSHNRLLYYYRMVGDSITQRIGLDKLI